MENNKRFNSINQQLLDKYLYQVQVNRKPSLVEYSLTIHSLWAIGLYIVCYYVFDWSFTLSAILSFGLWFLKFYRSYEPFYLKCNVKTKSFYMVVANITKQAFTNPSKLNENYKFKALEFLDIDFSHVPFGFGKDKKKKKAKSTKKVSKK